MTRTYLLTVLLSLLPVSELRGAIPFACINGVPLHIAAALSFVANAMVPVIGFIFFATLHRLLDRWSFYHRLFDRTIERARIKVGNKVSKYGLLGLMLFVAVPLPITGAWTGTIGAWILGLDRKKSTFFIILGVLIACIVVSMVVLTGSSLSKLFTKSVSL